MSRTVRRALLYALTLVLIALMAWPAAAAPASYEVDLAHSTLLFRIKHLDLGYVYGRFNDFSGSFVVDDANPSNAKVEITARIESVDTGNEKRDQHLKSPDFFNVAQFPTMTFRSTSVAKAGDGYTVTGTLDLHGITKSVAIKMTKVGEGKDPWGNERIGFEGQMSFERSDFGMDKMQEAVGDTVWVTVAVEGIKK